MDAGQDRDQLYLCTIVQAEIEMGIRLLPAGRRQSELTKAANLIFSEFGARLLTFDNAAASAFGDIFTKRRVLGRPLSAFDGLIAATALSTRAKIATRDIKGFEGCGIELVNPWHQD